MSLRIHWSVICNKQFHLIATSRNDIVSQRWYIYVLYVYIHISSFFSFSSVILVFARRFSFIFFPAFQSAISSTKYEIRNGKRKFTLVCFLLTFTFSCFVTNFPDIRAFFIFILSSLLFLTLHSVHAISTMNRHYIHTKQFQEFYNRIKLRDTFSRSRRRNEEDESVVVTYFLFNVIVSRAVHFITLTVIWFLSSFCRFCFSFSFGHVCHVFLISKTKTVCLINLDFKRERKKRNKNSLTL